MDKYGSAHYFSESQKQNIHVDAMAMPYARNVFAKLTRDDGKNFVGSLLAQALSQKLCPSKSVAKTLLATKGECTYWYAGDAKARAAARRMFTSIGKSLGVGVDIEVDDKGEWVTARCEPVGMEVNVRRVR